MALTPTYAFRASECPAPQEPLAPLYKGADPPAPVSADSLVSGGGTAAAQSFVTKFNRNAVRLDLAHRYSGPGIWWGLDLSAGSGLTGRIAVGQAGIDGVAEVKNDAGYTTLALTDGAVNRVWLSRGGTLNKVLGGSASPLAPPDTATLWHYLGAFVTAGGTIIQIDRSGVLFAGQRGLLWRQTADTAEPDDEPPETVQLLTRTVGGLYLWDGTQYSRIDSDQADLIEDNLALTQELAEEGRKRRRLLLNLVTTFGLAELAAGLEDDFALAAAEAG